MAKVKSVFQDEKECFVCKSPAVEEHHIFQGSFRNNSEKYGLKVYLCTKHHTGAEGVHPNHGMLEALKRMAQARFEKTHTREEFIKEFGRSYL